MAVFKRLTNCATVNGDPVAVNAGSFTSAGPGPVPGTPSVPVPVLVTPRFTG